MPNLCAFRALRYRDIDLSRVICPAPGAILAEARAALRELHPRNAVRLIARDAADGPNVRQTLHRWREEGVLVRDDAPHVYVYRHDFTRADGAGGRVAGVIGALQLEDFAEGSVTDYAGVHQYNRPDAKAVESALHVLRTTQLNVSPNYALHRGRGAARGYIDALDEREPDAFAVDAAGGRHRLWAIGEACDIEALTRPISAGPIVIADGDEGYEAAMMYSAEEHGRRELRTAMCLCVDADAEDVAALPYHRAISSATQVADLERRLDDLFALSTVMSGPLEALHASDADHAFIFALRDTYLLIEIAHETVVQHLDEGVAGDSVDDLDRLEADAWLRLDVVALEEVVLARAFLDGVDDVIYSADASEILRLVREGSAHAGVLMRPLPAGQVIDVARSFERLPEKTCYFSPKPVTGFVFDVWGAA